MALDVATEHGTLRVEVTPPQPLLLGRSSIAQKNRLVGVPMLDLQRLVHTQALSFRLRGVLDEIAASKLSLEISLYSIVRGAIVASNFISLLTRLNILVFCTFDSLC